MAIPRERAIRIVIWAALFAGAVGAGLWAASAFAPERIRQLAERALSDLFGSAEIGSISLGWSEGPALVAKAIEVTEEENVILLLDRVELGLDLLRIFRGEGRFDRLEISGLSLRLERLADGSFRPARLAEILERRRARPPGDGARPNEAQGIRLIEIREGRVVLSAEGATPSPLVIESIALRVRLGAELEATGSGLIDGASFEFFVRGPEEARSFRASITRVALSDLRPWWPDPEALLPELEGTLAASLQGNTAGPHLTLNRFDVELGSALFEGRALPLLRIGGQLELGPDSVALRDLRASADALVLSIDGVLPRDPRADSTVQGRIATQRIDLDTLLDHTDALGFSEVRAPLSRLETGVIDSLVLTATALPWEALQVWSRDPTRWPAGLRLDASFHEISIPLDEGEPLRNLRGRIELDPDRLALREIRAELGERPLPGLEIEVAGWSRLAEAGTRTHLDEVPPLRGREALMKWLDATRKPTPGWSSARVELDWLDHPALLRPLERAAATLRPLSPGIAIDLHGARWGGVWVSGSGRLLGKCPDESIEFELRTHPSAPAQLGDRVESVVRNTPMERSREAWSAGRAEVELHEFAGFGTRRAVLSFEANGTQLRSAEVSFDLEPAGILRGNLDLELGKSEAVPYRASFQVSGAHLDAVLEDLGAKGSLTEGHLVLAADLTGRLRAGETILTSLRGPISAHSRDGVINQRMPWALAIAAVSETLNPFRSHKTLPYDAIDTNFVLEGGRLDARSIAITGPTLRLVATGSLHFETPNRLEAVVGLFFFRGIDKVLGSVPILSTLLLGSDENLVSAYFSLEGRWNKPRAKLVPVKTLLDGPGNIVVKGVPTFVRGGLTRLRRVFSTRSSKRRKAREESLP